jgi:molybdate transport system substrate-binding protein
MKLAALTFVFLLAAGAHVQAAEITVVSTNAVKTVLEELRPQFERASSHKLALRFAPTSEIKARIEKGEVCDVAILTAAATDDLIRQAKLDAATRTEIARAGIGVAIRKGATKPDLSSEGAFKSALLQTKSIAYTGAGFTGSNLRKIFERFGIADEMKGKTRLVSGNTAEAVSRGEAEMGLTLASEILHVTGAEFAGLLPPEVQVYTVFTAATATGARYGEAGRALIDFLRAPAAVPVLKANGLEAAGQGSR